MAAPRRSRSVWSGGRISTSDGTTSPTAPTSPSASLNAPSVPGGMAGTRSPTRAAVSPQHVAGRIGRVAGEQPSPPAARPHAEIPQAARRTAPRSTPARHHQDLHLADRPLGLASTCRFSNEPPSLPQRLHRQLRRRVGAFDHRPRRAVSVDPCHAATVRPLGAVPRATATQSLERLVELATIVSGNIPDAIDRSPCFRPCGDHPHPRGAAPPACCNSSSDSQPHLRRQFSDRPISHHQRLQTLIRAG